MIRVRNFFLIVKLRILYCIYFYNQIKNREHKTAIANLFWKFNTDGEELLKFLTEVKEDDEFHIEKLSRNSRLSDIGLRYLVR